jgi:hypothetical protein
MTNRISIETLSPITHNQIPVVTTELLANLYGTDTANIKKNYSRNKDRFVEGKHYFLIKGEQLRELKNSVTSSHQVDKRTPKLTLWTERGAARHAKMLETDQAWEVFEKLEDFYFSQKDKSSSTDVTPISTPADARYNVKVIIHDNWMGGGIELLGKGDTFRAIANGIATDLGYKPHAFTHIPASKEKFKRIH